jgi:hypothetical protein
MRPTRLIGFALCVAAVTAMASASAQGKGGGQGRGGDNKPEKAQGRGASRQDKPGKAMSRGSNAQGRSDRARGLDKPGKAVPETRGAVIREEAGGEVFRTNPRSLAASNKHGERLVGRAISQANKRGVSDDDLVVTPLGQRMLILNRAGHLLVDVDGDRDVGVWKAVSARETDKEGSPSFCRSGAGHPVWGRQWCVDKGFGLGLDQDIRWSRVIGIDNVVFRREMSDADLARNVLFDVLGDVVFNRLATHAITLGFVEPLTGRWIGQPSVGPRVLQVSSGPRPVAEVVDVNRDGRADLLLVATRP